jgi:hypothetical protein
MGARFQFLIFGITVFFMGFSTDSAGVIGHDNSTSSSSASASSLTWSHTTSGTNRVMVIGLAFSASVSLSSVAYDGVSISMNSQSNGTRTHAYGRLTNPNTGTHDVVVTLSGSGIVLRGAVTLTGNDNSSLNGFGSSSGTSATPSTTQAVTTGEWVIDIISTDDQQITTVGALQTERVNVFQTFGLAMSTEPEAGSSPLTMSWTLAASDNYNHTKWWLNVGSSLPVILYSFFANCNNQNQVDVSWTTGSEINNDYFTVERSSDGLSFEEVARLSGAGNSNTPLHYKITDETPVKGVSYYRLKQTDFDGKYEVFPMAPVRDCDDPEEKLKVTLIADPSREQKTIIYRLSQNGKVIIEWYNSLGEAVRLREVLIQPEGAYEYPVRLESSAPGIYFGVFRLEDEVRVCKIIVN